VWVSSVCPRLRGRAIVVYFPCCRRVLGAGPAHGGCGVGHYPLTPGAPGAHQPDDVGSRPLVVGPCWSLPRSSVATPPPTRAGELVSHHRNPYCTGPSSWVTTPTRHRSDNLWGNAPAPYWPLFLQLDGSSPPGSPSTTNWPPSCCWRLVALVGCVLMPPAVPLLARLYHRDDRRGVYPDVLNPVTILHPHRAAPHNDALICFVPLVAASPPPRRSRPIVAQQSFARLATAIKAPAALRISMRMELAGGPGLDRDRISAGGSPPASSGAAVLGFFSYVSGLGGGGRHLGTPGVGRSWTLPPLRSRCVSQGASISPISASVWAASYRDPLFRAPTAATPRCCCSFNSDRVRRAESPGHHLAAVRSSWSQSVQPWYLSWADSCWQPVAWPAPFAITLAMVTAFIELPWPPNWSTN